MNKARSRKIEPVRSQKPSDRKFEPSGGSAGKPVLAEIWKEEVAALRSRHFAGLEEAVSCLVQCVADRLKLQGKERDETAEYLRFLFETDEFLRDDLEKSLSIGVKQEA